MRKQPYPRRGRDAPWDREVRHLPAVRRTDSSDPPRSIQPADYQPTHDESLRLHILYELEHLVCLAVDTRCHQQAFFVIMYKELLPESQNAPR